MNSLPYGEVQFPLPHSAAYSARLGLLLYFLYTYRQSAVILNIHIIISSQIFKLVLASGTMHCEFSLTCADLWQE